ncbi:MAG: SAVMC3_10250 family protein [Salibacteraceae bacterium]
MKYYLYLSKSKVEMLFPQIPKAEKDNIATELKLDLKIFSASFKDQVEKDTLFSMMRVVENYIEKKEAVGTIDFPGAYFKGEIPMTYGIFKDYGSDLTYFKTETEASVLILIGRTQNIVGISNPETLLHPEAISPNYYFLKYINRILENHSDIISFDESPWTPENLIKILNKSVEQVDGPTQNLSFLAKKIYHVEGIGKSKNIILGTPLYVELKE